MELNRRSFLLGAGATGLSACSGEIPDLRGNFNSGYRDTNRLTRANIIETQPWVNPQQIEMRKMRYYGSELPGTIIINFQGFKLYHIEYDETATEYPIALGRIGLNANYDHMYVARKAVNPTWTPTQDMRRRDPSLPIQVRGGSPHNPLGSHAIYFYDARNGTDTYIRAHGTNESARRTIGTNASSGCFRMLNEHAEHLYAHVRIGSGSPSRAIGKSKLTAHKTSLNLPGMDYRYARVLGATDIAVDIVAENSLPRPRLVVPAFN